MNPDPQAEFSSRSRGDRPDANVIGDPPRSIIEGDVVWSLFQTPYLRYLLTGGLAAAVEYGSFLILQSALPLGYLWAHGISIYLGFVCSFVLNKFWSFKNREPMGWQFFLANLLLVFNLIVTSFLLAKLVGGAHLQPSIAKIACMVGVALWNFLLFRVAIFRQVPN